jgi:hypothetical protein
MIDFNNTRNKLEDSRSALASLKQASNSIDFRVAFSAFINNSRAITYAMQSDGSKNKDFMEWYE